MMAQGHERTFGLPRFARTRAGFVILLAIIGAALSVVYIVVTPTSYTASAQIFVTVVTPDSTSDVSNVNALNAGNAFAQARVQSYPPLVTGPSVTGPVIRQLNLHISERKLASKITADAPLNQVLLNVQVKDPSANHAANLANAVANEAIKVIINTEAAGNSKGRSPVALKVVRTATPPASPTAPLTTLSLLVGVLGGVLVGLAIAIVRERLNPRVRTALDVEDVTAVPLLAAVPYERSAQKQALARPGSPRTDSYRRLATYLQFIDVTAPPRVIAIATPWWSEGNTVAALNAARFLAETGKSVCLVEANLRRPRLAALIGYDDSRGLSTVLADNQDWAAAAQTPHPNLSVITAGPVRPDPGGLMVSPRLREVVADLASRFDFVLIDTAPLLPVADGLQLVSIADTTVLVVRARKATARRVLEAQELVTRLQRDVGGVVLTMAPNARS